MFYADVLELSNKQQERIKELKKVALELVSIIECHHESAYCDIFDYDELEAAKELLKETEL
jgi:hypothetical protein